MNPAQEQAIASPNYLAIEALDPRYRRQAGEHSELLTVEAGWE